MGRFLRALAVVSTCLVLTFGAVGCGGDEKKPADKAGGPAKTDKAGTADKKDK